VGLCVAYGVVLGLGYGFRTDLLVNIPPIVIVLALFLDGGVRQHLATKSLGLAAFVLAFVVTAWPILNFVSSQGGAQWHVVLLGFSDEFDAPLRIERAPYRLGGFYSDSYVARVSLAYAARVHPEWHDVGIFTPAYDAATAAYVRELVTHFPADMMTRAYASVFALTHLPFACPGPPLDNFASWIYRPREFIFKFVQRAGAFLVVGAIAVAAAHSLRLALFLVFFLFYFGGYPALQFAPRHYFHLEFMTWWAAGFLVYQVTRRPPGEWSLKRLGVFSVVAAILVLVPWGALRLYQGGRALRMLRASVDAPKIPIELGSHEPSQLLAIQGPTAFNDERLIEIDVRGSACGPAPSVAFRYDSKQPDYDFSQVVPVPTGTGDHAPTRIFMPVFAHVFKGV